MDNIGLQPPILNSIPTTPAAVPTEEPKIVSPRGKFGQTMKKHGTKFLVGGLLTLLLGAGVWLEVNVVQQRQQTEAQADDYPGEPCNVCRQSQCVATRTPGCGYSDCTTNEDCKNNEEPPDASASPVPSCNWGNWGTCFGGCGGPGAGTQWREGNCDPWSELRSCDLPVCTTGSPSPVPSRSPRPSASPASGTVACTSLESSASAPTLGQTVQYTCHGNFSIHGQGLPVAFFRYSTDNGANWTPAAAQTGANFNIANININKNGNWIVQCRICIDSSANTCTTWGQAN